MYVIRSECNYKNCQSDAIATHTRRALTNTADAAQLHATATITGHDTPTAPTQARTAPSHNRLDSDATRLYTSTSLSWSRFCESPLPACLARSRSRAQPTPDEMHSMTRRQQVAV